MKSALIVFPGSNCDRDMTVALEQTTGHKPQIIWHKDSVLPKVDLVVIPGGFSFGDYLRCGAIAANSPVMKAVIEQAKRGTRLMGICNGFQILTETGILPGVLMRNAGLKFVCKDIWLKCENRKTVFTNRIKGPIRIPVAHHDGNYFDTADNLKALNDNDQVAFRYVAAPDCPAAEAACFNPNGSLENIAGVFNKRKTVLGMMPHPERAVDPALAGLPVKAPGKARVKARVESPAEGSGRADGWTGGRTGGRAVFASLIEGFA